jgi:membrane protein insertase Oxa1/YidC/SpoIIIJ
MLAISKFLHILNYVGCACFLIWFIQTIYNVVTQGFQVLAFASSDLIFIICSMIFAFLFGLNSHAHGSLTNMIDGILSLIIFGCMCFAVYSFGIFKGLVLYYLLMEIISFTQKR